MFNLNFYFMKLQVQSIHFDADQKLIDFIQKKIDKLETFYDRMVDGEVFLRLNNEGIENNLFITITRPKKTLRWHPKEFTSKH